MFTYSYGSSFNFQVGLFFIIIEMFICLASQTDVNQTVHMSPTKKELLLKNIEIEKWQKLLKEKQEKTQMFDHEYLKTR